VKQERAIDALLSGETVSEASRKVRVDRSTVYRWLEDPSFVASLNSRRWEMRAANEVQLQLLQSIALEQVRAAIERGNATIALAVLKGSGVLTGVPPSIGPVTPAAVAREVRAREKSDELDDLINSIG
jgi:transposase-like protein